MINIEITINETQWYRELPNETCAFTLFSMETEKAMLTLRDFQQLSRTLLSASIAHLKLEQQKGELSLVFTNDINIQTINQQWRKKNKATNVLSFPVVIPTSCCEKPFLGDILFAYETIHNEALAVQKPFYVHFAHLFIHGFLHLLGYDHIDEREAEKMEETEISILKKLSLPNPYESRPLPSKS